MKCAYRAAPDAGRAGDEGVVVLLLRLVVHDPGQVKCDVIGVHSYNINITYAQQQRKVYTYNTYIQYVG